MSSGYIFIFLFIFIHFAAAQFGEIASIVTGLLGSGGGLAGLAGTGASVGTGAASAASGALSGIAPLYQLAQAALQLTGTGVGIANQASESAWFPVAVENAARINRDFQESLLKSGRSNEIIESGRSATFQKPDEKIDNTYGKNYEDKEEIDADVSVEQPNSSANFAGKLQLPNLSSLLPGESSTSQTNVSRNQKENSEEARLHSIYEPNINQSLGSVTNNRKVKLVPKVNIKLPTVLNSIAINNRDEIHVNYNYENNKTNFTPSIDFNKDKESTTNVPVDDSELINESSNQINSSLHELLTYVKEIDNNTDSMANMRNMVVDILNEEQNNNNSQMIPALQKLISILRKSNLNQEEIIEIIEQLKSNSNPRINTTPAAESKIKDAEINTDGGYKESNTFILRRENLERASLRNLETYKKVTNETKQILRNVKVNESSPPSILAMPRRHGLQLPYAVSPYHHHNMKLTAPSKEYSQVINDNTTVTSLNIAQPTSKAPFAVLNTLSTLPMISHEELQQSSAASRPQSANFFPQNQNLFYRLQKQAYDVMYQNYLNSYYPQYAAQYYENNHNPSRYLHGTRLFGLSPTYNIQIPQYSMEQYSQNYLRSFYPYYYNLSGRTVSKPIFTTPPAAADVHPVPLATTIKKYPRCEGNDLEKCARQHLCR